MSELRGSGVPTKNTQGCIGDIYTDTKTNEKYKCTFAYRNGCAGMFDCTWVKFDNKDKPEDVEVKQDDKAAANTKRTDYKSAYKKRK